MVANQKNRNVVTFFSLPISYSTWADISLKNSFNIAQKHNHPSGVCTPSEADFKITKKIKDAGVLFEISVLDHIIVAHDAYYSFADEVIM